MSWIAPTIADFGQSIGIASLALDEGGYLELALDTGGALSILQLPNAETTDMLVGLRRPLAPPAGATLRAALRLVDFRRMPQWQAQACTLDGDLSFTLRIPKHSFVASSLQEALEELFRLHDAAARG